MVSRKIVFKKKQTKKNLGRKSKTSKKHHKKRRISFRVKRGGDAARNLPSEINMLNVAIENYVEGSDAEARKAAMTTHLKKMVEICKSNKDLCLTNKDKLNDVINKLPNFDQKEKSDFKLKMFGVEKHLANLVDELKNANNEQDFKKVLNLLTGEKGAGCGMFNSTCKEEKAKQYAKALRIVFDSSLIQDVDGNEEKNNAMANLYKK